MSNKIDYEAEVRKVYYASRIKKIGVDNGHSAKPMYCVFKSAHVLLANAIGSPVKNRKDAWKSAYDAIQHTLKVEK